MTIVKENEVSNLFITHYNAIDASYSVWLIDSGCSNNMTNKKKLFKELDETQKVKARLGDDKEIQVKVKGMVTLKISQCKLKLHHGVQYAPSLEHNLLSLGQ